MDELAIQLLSGWWYDLGASMPNASLGVRKSYERQLYSRLSEAHSQELLYNTDRLKNPVLSNLGLNRVKLTVV